MRKENFHLIFVAFLLFISNKKEKKAKCMIQLKKCEKTTRITSMIIIKESSFFSLADTRIDNSNVHDKMMLKTSL